MKLSIVLVVSICFLITNKTHGLFEDYNTFPNTQISQARSVNLKTTPEDNMERMQRIAAKNGDVVVSGRWQPVRPGLWNERFPNQCSKFSQSPINIITSETVYDEELKEFVFENFDRKFRWTMKYDGYAIEFVPIYNNSRKIKVSGSNLGSLVFELANFHFHWGKNIKQGSEHQIDCESEAAEVHLVCKADDNGKTRYMVLGFMFRLAPNVNEELQFIINQMQRKIGDEKEFIIDTPLVSDRFALTKLLPRLDAINRSGYYRYNGSLTVPPCTEGITWNVFRRKIPIARRQAAIFNNENHVSHRPVQPVNARTVYRSANLF